VSISEGRTGRESRCGSRGRDCRSRPMTESVALAPTVLNALGGFERTLPGRGWNGQWVARQFLVTYRGAVSEARGSTDTLLYRPSPKQLGRPARTTPLQGRPGWPQYGLSSWLLCGSVWRPRRSMTGRAGNANRSRRIPSGGGKAHRVFSGKNRDPKAEAEEVDTQCQPDPARDSQSHGGSGENLAAGRCGRKGAEAVELASAECCRS
jgi:hypothetical protein